MNVNDNNDQLYGCVLILYNSDHLNTCVLILMIIMISCMGVY